MTKADATTLLTHMEWADAMVWNTVNALDPARTDAALKGRLHHVHLVQRIYLQIWQGQPHEVRELGSFASVEDVHVWARQYYAELRNALRMLEPSQLERPVTFPWADELVKWFGQARTATMQETIQQVAVHTAHHRGQLATMIRQLGGTPPLVDFIAWIWMGKPDPAWAPPQTA